MAEIDPVIAQLLQLTQQQTAPVPTLNTGLLAPGQQQLTDVFTDPDQAQVNALIGAVSGALNPRGGQPGLTALANAAQQFGGTRQTEFQNRLAQRKLQSQELRNKIQDTLGIANLSQSIRGGNLAERRFEEVALPAEERAAGKLSRVNLQIPQEGGGFKTVLALDDGRGSFFEPSTGERIQIPEGTRLATTGKTEEDLLAGGFSELTKGTKTNLQKKIVGAEDLLGRLDSIGDRFKSDFLTTEGRVKASVGGFLDKNVNLGGDAIDNILQQTGVTNDDLTEFRASRQQLVNEVEQLFQRFRIETTGVQAGLQEIQFLRAIFLNADLGPEEFSAVFQQIIDSETSKLGRLRGTLKSGISLDEGSQFEVDGVKVNIRRTKK